MSHFTVLVIGENPEEQLAPYSEQDEYYMSFIDKTKEVEKEYKTKKTSEFHCASDNSWGQEISQEFYKKLSKAKVGERFEQSVGKNGFGSYFKKGEHYRGYFTVPEKRERMKNSRWFKVVSILETTHPDKDICFEGKIKVERVTQPKRIPVNQVYKTIEAYAKDYHGYYKVNGKYGYRSNENAKWDWYQLGGRWTGFFKLKPGVNGGLGTPSLVSSRRAEVGTADQALKRNIDFDAMYSENLECSIKSYEEFKELYKKDPEKAEQEAYFNYGVYNTSGNREEFIPETKEKYLDRNASISTFAIVKDGKWYEKGEMGWWACVSNEKDTKEWNQEFKKLLDEIPEDTILSLYDCHI